MRPPPVRKEKYAAVAAKKLLPLAVVAQRIRLARSTKRKQIYITQTERVYVSKQRIEAKRRQPFLQKTEMRLARAARMRRCERCVREGARARIANKQATPLTVSYRQQASKQASKFFVF